MCSQRNSTLRKHLVKSQEHSRHSHTHEHQNFRSFLFKSIANHVVYTVNTTNQRSLSPELFLQYISKKKV